jgi:hypothetical protein
MCDEAGTELAVRFSMNVTAICFRCQLWGPRESTDPAPCPHCGAALIMSMVDGAGGDELAEMLHRTAMRQGSTHRLPGVALHVPRARRTSRPVATPRGEWIMAASSMAAGAGLASVLLRLF